MALNIEKICIRLLGEGTRTAKEAHALFLGDDLYCVLSAPDYDPEDEHWEFIPGSIVRCIMEGWSGEEILTANELVPLGGYEVKKV